jgi:hypothetical protein
VAPEQLHVSRGTLDTIGTVYPAGNTYYDQQHNGTPGKMIGVDELGFVHVVWMRGLDPDNDHGQRRVYYNVWDPDSRVFAFPAVGAPTGTLVDASTRAGYACLALLPNGWVFPAFHEIKPDDPNAPHASAAMDFAPTYGIFDAERPAFLYENSQSMELIWPKIAVGRDSTIHMVSMESPRDTTQAWQRIYYSRGHPTWNEDGDGLIVVWEPVDGNNQFMKIDSALAISPVIAASQRSDRVAIAWARPRFPSLLDTHRVVGGNSDIHLIVSEDGGLNWGNVINVTNFAYPDTQCVSGDTATCDRDTFRVFTDCSALFDRCDRLHLAFSTHLQFELEGMPDSIGTGWYMARYRLYHSDIWHWNEEYDEISNVVRGHFQYNEIDSTVNSYWTACGAWQLMVHRPSLAEDSVTGYLYCSYQRYDTAQFAAAVFSGGRGNIPLAEAYVAVSRNGGRTWSAGTDVTNSIADTAAPAGQCKSERDITIADNVTYSDGQGYVHMFYVFDGDGGTPLQSEGAVTLNPVCYQRIPINEIPATPINPEWQRNIHADNSHAVTLTDPEAIVNCTWRPDGLDDHQALRPETFRLYQNYPNPFNPVTNIQFDLVRDAKVTLKVFNVLGQEVATLFDAQPLRAGVQTAAFDASALASGVYVYRLDANGIVAARKMIVMK